MDERNATASWSGYLHQGKVGIFLVLQKINMLITQPNQDLSRWKIEYESAEDIDIKNDGIVESRHQVKAYKAAKYPNDYKDVLGILEYELGSNNNKVIKTKGFRICGFDDGLNTLPIEVNEDSRFLHTITETLGFGLEREEFNNTFKSAKYVENHNKIKLFEYPDGKKYCPLSNVNDELKVYCKNEIKKILTFENHIFKDNDIHQENVLNYIISYLDNEIRKKHNEGGDSYPELSFINVYDLIISTDNYKKLNIEFIRENFVKAWIRYLQELDECEIEYDRAHEEKVENIVKEIYSLDDVRFIQFLKNINPDENEIGNIDTIDDVMKVFKIDSLKDVFFRCLLEIKNEEFMIEDIGYGKDGGYLITAIDRPQMMVKLIVNSIITNSQITNEIFDKSYLVNGRIDDVSFEDILGSTSLENESSNKWGGRVSEKDKFYNPKMKFISVEQVKGKLNRERSKC